MIRLFRTWWSFQRDLLYSSSLSVRISYMAELQIHSETAGLPSHDTGFGAMLVWIKSYLPAVTPSLTSTALRSLDDWLGTCLAWGSTARSKYSPPRASLTMDNIELCTFKRLNIGVSYNGLCPLLLVCVT